MILLPLFVITQLSAVPADGPHAISRAEWLLATFGEPKPFRLQGLWDTDTRRGKMWTVQLSGPKGAFYEARLGPPGELTIARERRTGIFGGSDPTVDESGMKAVRRWLSMVGVHEPTRLITLSSTKDRASGSAYLAILRNGYPFVSRPDYGYHVSYTVPGHRFLSLDVREDPPEVDGIPPKLDEQAARAALQRIFESEIAEPLHRRYHWRRVWIDRVGVPELGYYLQTGRSRAGLVWRFSYWSMRDAGYAIQGGTSAMVIDAVTGSHVHVIEDGREISP